MVFEFSSNGVGPKKRACGPGVKKKFQKTLILVHCELYVDHNLMVIRRLQQGRNWCSKIIGMRTNIICYQT